MTDEDHKNTSCRNDRKDCIMEINGNHCETNNVCSILEEQNKGFVAKSVLKQTEVHVEVLHHGKYCICQNLFLVAKLNTRRLIVNYIKIKPPLD